MAAFLPRGGRGNLLLFSIPDVESKYYLYCLLSLPTYLYTYVYTVCLIIRTKDFPSFSFFFLSRVIVISNLHERVYIYLELIIRLNVES